MTSADNKMDDPSDLVSLVSKIGGKCWRFPQILRFPAARSALECAGLTALSLLTKSGVKPPQSKACLRHAKDLNFVPFRGAAMCLLVMLLSVSIAHSDDVIQRKFLLDEANLKMSSAKTPRDFAAAAGVYRRLVDAGVRNGVLFYNLGTALLLGGQYNAAERNLLRAERYLGSNWEIRHNLLIAMAGKDRDNDVSLPWYRALLFWHYGLSGAVRSIIAAMAFFMFWLALALGVVGFKRLAKPVAIVSIAVFVVFGSSVATSLHLEDLAENGRDYHSAPEKALRQ